MCCSHIDPGRQQAGLHVAFQIPDPIGAQARPPPRAPREPPDVHKLADRCKRPCAWEMSPSGQSKLDVKSYKHGPRIQTCLRTIRKHLHDWKPKHAWVCFL